MNPVHGTSDLSLQSAALIAACGASAWGILTKLPAQIWHWFLLTQTTSVETIGEDRFFKSVNAWVASLPYTKRSRRLMASLGSSQLPSSDEVQLPDLPRTVLAPGSHIFLHSGRLIWVVYVRNEARSGQSAWRESITIRVMGRSRRAMDDILKEIRTAEDAASRGVVRVYMSDSGYWSHLMRTRGRRADSLMLPEGAWESISGDVRRFLGREEWYRSTGIPYRRGYIFSGVPGSGKSTTAMAIATELGLNIYVVNLKDPLLTDTALARLMLSVPYKRSLVLLEDIDTAFIERKNDTGALTLGGLLNALDGSLAGEGRIVIMTTNHKSRLDDALIRPGRADRHFEFGYATEHQLRQLAERLTGSNHLPDVAAPVTMAQAQEYFLSNEGYVCDVR